MCDMGTMWEVVKGNPKHTFVDPVALVSENHARSI